MRSFIVFLLFVYSFCGSTAQTLLAEFPPLHPKENIENLLVAHETGGAFGICYASASSLVVQMLGQDGKTIYQKEIEDEDIMLAPKGVLASGDTYQFVYFNDMSQEYRVVMAGKTDSDKTSTSILSPFEPKDEYFGDILSNNELYCIGWNKATGQLKVGRYLKDKVLFSIKSITIADELAKKINRLGSLGAWQSLVPMTDATVPEPSTALGRQKIGLLKDGKIAISLDGKDYKKCQTELLLIDWEVGKLELLKMGPPVDARGKNPSSNSFVHDGHLAIFQIEPDLLYLAVYDIESRKLVKEHKYTHEEPFTIIGSAMFTEKGSYTVFNEPNLYSKLRNEAILKNMSNGKPFVYFEPNEDGDMVFTIGNEWVESNFVAPSGGMASGYVQYGNSFQKSRYFHALMDKLTYELKPGNALQKKFLSRQLKQFMEEHIEGTKTGIFTDEPKYRIVNIPGADYALIASYIKKEGMIKLHKIAL